MTSPSQLGTRSLVAPTFIKEVMIGTIHSGISYQLYWWVVFLIILFTERQVALRFFSSLAGSKLMGISVAEQKKRLQQVLKTLEEYVLKSGLT